MTIKWNRILTIALLKKMKMRNHVCYHQKIKVFPEFKSRYLMRRLNTAVYVFASGALEPSLTDAIIVPNAIAATSRWIITALGSLIALDSSTTNIS